MRLIPSARRVVGTVAMIAGMALLASGCASPQSSMPVATPQQGGTITFAVDVDPVGHLDVHSSQLDINAILMRPVFDSLVSQNADGGIVPWLAKSWSISDDGLRYTFVLRSDVKFTDGAPFNAAAVKANFDHIVAPATASAQASSMLGGDFYAGTTVIDDNTVQVDFLQPFAPFLHNAAAVQLGFYSPLVLAAHADELKAGGPGISVGTGPFILTSYTPGSELVFTKNPAYNWSPEGAAHQGRRDHRHPRREGPAGERGAHRRPDLGPGRHHRRYRARQHRPARHRLQPHLDDEPGRALLALSERDSAGLRKRRRAPRARGGL